MKEMIKDFLDELSSSSPTPGGGGASGLVGAIGCALGLMVGNLTVGKKKYKDVEDEIREIMEKLEDLKKKLVTSVDDDAETLSLSQRLIGFLRILRKKRNIKSL